MDVGSADVVLSQPGVQPAEIAPSAAAAQPTPASNPPPKTASEALVKAILRVRNKVVQTPPAEAESVRGAVVHTEQSTPIEEGRVEATVETKMVENVNESGNGAETGTGNRNGRGPETELPRSLTPTGSIENVEAGMKRKAEGEGGGLVGPGEGDICPMKRQKRSEAGANERESGGSESAAWQSVTADFEENDEMFNVEKTDLEAKPFDEPAATGAAEPTGSAEERPTEAPPEVRQPGKEDESHESVVEGDPARLQETPAERMSEQGKTEMGRPESGVGAPKTEGVTLEKPLMEMLAGFGARPPAASSEPGDATREKRESAKSVPEDRPPCVPLAEPIALRAESEERKSSAEGGRAAERKVSVVRTSSAEQKRLLENESAVGADQKVDVGSSAKTPQKPVNAAGKIGPTGGLKSDGACTPVAVTGGMSKDSSGTEARPRPAFSDFSNGRDVPRDARAPHIGRQTSVYRIPQERMRAVLSPNRAPVKLCAAYAQDPEGCTDLFCEYSHASKEESFCLQYFDKSDRGIGPGCHFGERRCFFGHGEASRAVYLSTGVGSHSLTPISVRL
ncbi:hypothetical protein KFL_000630330 [Klebsormidium nitens]|uniref:Uncharacterized protein n=1 Tax=Klebsormidium nitens TaxID=105231 RepID=A0A1Y1HV28_KLENI|nr:hypothetical protein KFL_000630330 [Klebsormidium nitens]|eukprot:GAQ80831.1 hypothetical protein KFL_000630330 [Klebsormidium nitens]